MIGPLVMRADAAWPKQLSLAQLPGDVGFTPLAEDALLLALLTSAPNTDIPLERFLTMLRGAMLRELAHNSDTDSQAEHFAAALAQQCFINDYVFLPGEGRTCGGAGVGGNGLAYRADAASAGGVIHPAPHPPLCGRAAGAVMAGAGGGGASPAAA